MKKLFIAEKPSVAQQFRDALARGGKESFSRHDGYEESDSFVVTWCVGHLVTMSYPEKYDMKYKKWSFDTLPFLPETFKYEVIPDVSKQYKIVAGLLRRADVGTIYICTDSGREGEYIYRLVAMMAGLGEKDKEQKRVWIDSQTDEEILRGIREAKDISAYDDLSDAAFCRAKEDYLMGINFSRALSLKYARTISDYLDSRYQAVSVGRVMTCVLGMVVRREREIRNFVKTPFYRVLAGMNLSGSSFDGEWRAVAGSRYENSPKLYKENGWKERADAEALIEELRQIQPQEGIVEKIERKQVKKNPPLLYNLAEIQNDCSRKFKINPDQTLSIIQELYEKKLVTYPRTDARVLSSAIAKVIDKNIRGLTHYGPAAAFASAALDGGSWKKIGSTRYTNDRQITDHYAIIPTGQGLGALKSLAPLKAKVYDLIVRRFLSIFYPPAVYRKVNMTVKVGTESFFSAFSVLENPGYLEVLTLPKKGGTQADAGNLASEAEPQGESPDGRKDEDAGEEKADASLLEALSHVRRGSKIPIDGYQIKEGETSPPKRYTSGSMILAMENAGQLIEDEELREQIKGSGIGTSATRAGILTKLDKIGYLQTNKKTQVITPTQMGEMVYDVVYASIRSLLNPELTASWEKGLTYVAEGTISQEEYMQKLENFVARHTDNVKGLNNQSVLRRAFDAEAPYYRKAGPGRKSAPGSGKRNRGRTTRRAGTAKK